MLIFPAFFFSLSAARRTGYPRGELRGNHRSEPRGNPRSPRRSTSPCAFFFRRQQRSFLEIRKEEAYLFFCLRLRSQPTSVQPTDQLCAFHVLHQSQQELPTARSRRKERKKATAELSLTFRSCDSQTVSRQSSRMERSYAEERQSSSEIAEKLC